VDAADHQGVAGVSKNVAVGTSSVKNQYRLVDSPPDYSGIVTHSSSASGW
jgi:hypothetical protein